MVRCLVLLAVSFGLCSVSEAGIFSWRIVRRSAASSSCSSGSCQKSTAVQKTAVQKTAVQKTETPAKDETATQKDAVQKTSDAPKKATQKSASTENNSLYALCLRKAQRQAALGRCCHVGGGFGGARAEGVGMAMSAAAALSNCCFTGQRRLAASAVVRGSNGRYYACKLFW